MPRCATGRLRSACPWLRAAQVGWRRCRSRRSQEPIDLLARTTIRVRRLLDKSEERHSDDRILDFGVRLYTVHQDESGIEVQPGRPRVVATEYQSFGGLLDTRTMEFVGPSKNPVVLFASPEQTRLIVHDRNDLPTRLLTYGAEGAGKTRGVLAPWMLLRALEFTGIPGAEIGGTAPTDKRLGRLLQALFEILPREWYTYRAHDRLFTLRNGVCLRLAATKAYSADVGSPIQGWDWMACASDELQDSINANDDIETRGRRAVMGEYLRMCSATAKDNPSWRTFRDGIAGNPLWQIARLPGFTNPFVFGQHWKNLRATLDERAYRRRVLAEDVGPERMVYHTWDRSQNLHPVPMVGARDITAQMLRGYGNCSILVGHDPGKLQDVSILLKAYQIKGIKGPVWYVVGEVTTEGTTSEQHVQELSRVLSDEWGCLQRDFSGRLLPDSPMPHVRIDPFGDTDNKTHRSIYQTFRSAGLEARSAAYRPGAKSGVVPKEARIEMICRLLCSASGVRRLRIACDQDHRPVAAKLVEAFEMSERDEGGQAEAGRKNKYDLSHWPAGLGYALWAFERNPLMYAEEEDNAGTA